MKKRLILTASVVMFGLFAFTSVANVATINNTNNIVCVGEDCDKCGKKDCSGKCDTKSSKKECTTAQKKACCSQSAKKSCGTKTTESTEEKKN